MKTTRNLKVKDRVFSLEDIQRIANIIGEQKVKANEADVHSSASYLLDFADETRIEVEDSVAISDELLARPARVVKVEFDFHDYENKRSINFTIRHGDSPWDSGARISGEDRAWVDGQFLAVKEAVEAAKPQTSAPRRFQGLILHASALGIGSLGQMALDVFIGSVLVWLDVFGNIQPVDQDSKFRAVLISLGPILYALLWIWRWILGLAWGAFAVRSWLVSLWPSVEFSFGPEHHRIEEIRRRRLAGFSTLVLVPIFIAITYDVAKFLL